MLLQRLGRHARLGELLCGAAGRCHAADLISNLLGAFANDCQSGRLSSSGIALESNDSIPVGKDEFDCAALAVIQVLDSQSGSDGFRNEARKSISVLHHRANILLLQSEHFRRCVAPSRRPVALSRYFDEFTLPRSTF